MSQPASILEQLGSQWQWPAYVLSVCFDKANNLAFALGDGSVRLLPADADHEPFTIQAHEGAVLSLSSAPKTGFLSGGDDGRFMRIDADGTLTELAAFQGRWIDHVASHASGVMACTEGKRLHLYPGKGQPLVREFPSTVGGICFAPNGYRMAVAHYGGVTLCSTRSVDSTPVLLKCPGSHLAVTWSPDSRFVISAMQEECLRGWRLEDNDALFMSGYSAKVKSWAWFNGGRYLATSGSPCAPCWSFKGRKGPKGREPLTPGESTSALVTAVAGDPKHAILAIGYDNGQIIIAEPLRDQEVVVKPPGNGAISTMCWSSDGNWLVFGTETGLAGRLPVGG